MSSDKNGIVLIIEIRASIFMENNEYNEKIMIQMITQFSLSGGEKRESWFYNQPWDKFTNIWGYLDRYVHVIYIYIYNEQGQLFQYMVL